MPLTIHRGELLEPDVQELIALHVAAMQAHSPPKACHVIPPSGLDHPSITFFTARDGEQLLGIGALKDLGDGTGEIKSMRTAPSALRQGVGRALLTAIISGARQRGYRALLLETGRTADFHAANELYEHVGFTPAEPFGGYPAGPFTRFMRLDL